MNIEAILDSSEIVQLIGDKTLLTSAFKDICYSTDKAGENIVFFGLKGRTNDGIHFIEKAYDKGSRVFVGETERPVPKDSLLIVVKDSRKALSYASNVFFDYPSQKLTMIGVTGTKGKTTTTTLLFKILKKLGTQTGVIGTNGVFFNDEFLPTANTTPESYELHRLLAKMVDSGISVCFMEVSSQGLMMKRVEHIDFNIGVFTNMALDHIGELEHPNFEDYLFWKTYLFELCDIAVVNADDEYVDSFTKNKALTVIKYGINHVADYTAKNIEPLFNKTSIGISFSASTPRDEMVNILLPVPGQFNIYNALVVIAVAEYLGHTIHDVAKALAVTTVAGRMEVIPNYKNVLAVLDYAHNGFSLENVVKTLQQYDYHKLLILFGSVGDRSQTRRKELGDIVAKYADVAMITSDNPGKEDPMSIINDIAESFVSSDCIVYKEPLREKAIQKIVDLSESGDIILFAGKGHETYQLIGTEKVPFNEKQIIIEAFWQ